VSIMSRTRAVALLVAAAASSASGPGCSLVIESRDQQCAEDADCSGFAQAVCDAARGVCVPGSGTTATGTGGAGGGCVGPDGCYACVPENQTDLLNACTDAECIPYDNTQLQGLLLEDGSVPPVP
jgi:hypothetical protein